jgi:hypothetical protein
LHPTGIKHRSHGSPHPWYFTVLSALLYITAEIFVYLEKTGVIDGLIGVTTKFFQVVLILFFIFVVMGIVKYYVTGSPEPFVSVDISKSSESQKEE